MVILTIYILSLAIYLYVFMYQRTALNIARVLDMPVNETKAILTPGWVVVLGLMGTLGVYGTPILIWIWIGFLQALLASLFSFVLCVFSPIPHKYYFKMILNHLNSQIQKSNGEKQDAYKSLKESIIGIEKRYSITK